MAQDAQEHNNGDREAGTSFKANTKNQCRISGWTHVSGFFKQSREQPIQVISSPTFGEQFQFRFRLSFWGVLCFWKTKEPSSPPQTSSANIFDPAPHSDSKTQRLKMSNLSRNLQAKCICSASAPTIRSDIAGRAPFGKKPRQDQDK
jgi:hypothetical protein